MLSPPLVKNSAKEINPTATLPKIASSKRLSHARLTSPHDSFSTHETRLECEIPRAFHTQPPIAHSEKEVSRPHYLAPRYLARALLSPALERPSPPRSASVLHFPKAQRRNAVAENRKG